MSEQFNLALVNELITAAIPDREVLVWRERRITYRQLGDRSRRLASYLHERGLGVTRERDELAGHESGQDHVALYMYNGNEYLESMLGAFKSRAVPINVNYRYVEDELVYLFRNSQARAVIYHGCFADRIAAIRPKLPELTVLIQVEDGSGAALLPDAVDYETALADTEADLPGIGHSPDDLYALYTGGTTGMPKGVLWRQHDIFMNCMGGRVPGAWDPVTSYDDVRTRATAGGDLSMLLIPPFMHGAAQWASFVLMSNGAKVVIPDDNTHLDPAGVLRCVER